MTSAQIFPSIWVRVRNRDVGVVMTELVRRLRAAGWSGPDRVPDDGAYCRRLKTNWANAGHALNTAPLSEWSNHAYGTAVDLDWNSNKYRDVRPPDYWKHTTMPRSSARIAAELGLEWGGSWSGPWDPMHYEVAVSPARLAEIAAAIRQEEDLSIMDHQTKTYLEGKFDSVVGRLDLIRLGDHPNPPGGDTHPANLDTILTLVRNIEKELGDLKRQLATTHAPGAPSGTPPP
jgi:hypothetical protein